MIILKIIIAVFWAIICLPLAVVIFYVIESYELAKIFSSWIEDILRQ